MESTSVTKVAAVVIRWEMSCAFLAFEPLTQHFCYSFTGVIIVSLSDSSQTVTRNDAVSVILDTASKVGRFIHDGEYSNPLLGDFLALSSALFYAFYVILLKVKIRQESRINMQLFFGFVGLLSILFLWPLGLILHYTGAETFELPSDGKAIGGLLVNVSGNATNLHRGTETP